MLLLDLQIVHYYGANTEHCAVQLVEVSTKYAACFERNIRDHQGRQQGRSGGKDGEREVHSRDGALPTGGGFRRENRNR